MRTANAEFEVLLSSPTPVEAEMAKALLEEHGIPSMLLGTDRVLASLGYAVAPTPDLYVPRAAKQEAKAILKSTWDASALESAPPGESWSDGRELRASDREAEAVTRRSTRNLVIWLVFLAAVAAILATLVSDHLARRA